MEYRCRRSGRRELVGLREQPHDVLRAQRTAAIMVAPVASPSSTSRQGRPSSSAGGESEWSRRSSSSASADADATARATWPPVSPSPPANVDAALRRNGADRVLGRPRMPHLADGERVEGKLQGSRDLVGDDDAAAGQAENDGVGGRLRLDGRHEQPSCNAAVAEERWVGDQIRELGHQAEHRCSASGRNRCTR